MKLSAFLFLAFLALTASFTTAARYHKPNGHHSHDHGSTGDPGGIPGAPPGFFGPGGGFGIPGFGSGWPGMGGAPGAAGGYGSGYGGPSGGSSSGGIIRPTVVCKDKGPCYMKKLRCPAKCFTSFHSSGKGYGGGGGGGGCTIDCKSKCSAYC